MFSSVIRYKNEPKSTLKVSGPPVKGVLPEVAKMSPGANWDTALKYNAPPGPHDKHDVSGNRRNCKRGCKIAPDVFWLILSSGPVLLNAVRGPLYNICGL